MLQKAPIGKHLISGTGSFKPITDHFHIGSIVPTHFLAPNTVYPTVNHQYLAFLDILEHRTKMVVGQDREVALHANPGPSCADTEFPGRVRWTASPVDPSIPGNRCKGQ